MPRKYVAVCGASEANASQLESAREAGKLLALVSWSVKALDTVGTAAEAVRRALE